VRLAPAVQERPRCQVLLRRRLASAHCCRQRRLPLVDSAVAVGQLTVNLPPLHHQRREHQKQVMASHSTLTRQALFSRSTRMQHRCRKRLLHCQGKSSRSSCRAHHHVCRELCQPATHSSLGLSGRARVHGQVDVVSASSLLAGREGPLHQSGSTAAVPTSRCPAPQGLCLLDGAASQQLVAAVDQPMQFNVGRAAKRHGPARRRKGWALVIISVIMSSLVSGSY